jgi:Zn-dependent protease/CBS domain-containing protein
MYGRGVELFKLFGFSVRIDWSWLIIAVLVTWSLAVGYFPAYYPDLSVTTYWWMGVIGAVGLFASIVVHEFAHSLVARRKGVPMKGITLFVFGGVAEMQEEPPNPGAEFFLAIAGPIASVLIAVAAFGVASAGRAAAWPVQVTGIFGYLAWINTILVIFNMVPAFPLDGGRILRSLLWKTTGSLRKATRITSYTGIAFGLVLIGLGIFSFIAGAFVIGIWWVLLGLFLQSAARMSYAQMMMRRVLEGEPIGRFVQRPAHTVPASISVQELVDEHVFRHHFKMFPVTDEGHLLGCVTTRDISRVPRDQWSQRQVQEITEPCAEQNSIPLDADAMEALKKMHRHSVSRLLVMDNGHLEGIVSLKDLMRLISLKLELEGESGDALSEREAERLIEAR